MPRKRKSNNFPRGLKRARTLNRLVQEDFAFGTNIRTMGRLEAGTSQPTLTKVDELADVIGIHPLALLAMAYYDLRDPTTVRSKLEPVLAELEAMVGKRLPVKRPKRPRT